MLHPRHHHHLSPGSLKSSSKDPPAPALPSCRPFSMRKPEWPCKNGNPTGHSPTHQSRSSLQDVKVHTSRFYGLLRSPFCAFSMLWTYWSTFYSSNMPSSHCVRALISVTDSRVTVLPSLKSTQTSPPQRGFQPPATLPTVFTHPSATPSPNSISLSTKQVSLLDIKQGNNF